MDILILGQILGRRTVLVLGPVGLWHKAHGKATPHPLSLQLCTSLRLASNATAKLGAHTLSGIDISVLRESERTLAFRVGGPKLTYLRPGSATAPMHQYFTYALVFHRCGEFISAS
jgi:hypothetical protein